MKIRLPLILLLKFSMIDKTYIIKHIKRAAPTTDTALFLFNVSRNRIVLLF